MSLSRSLPFSIIFSFFSFSYAYVVAVVLVMLLHRSEVHGYSAFDCRGAPWPLDTTDNDVIMPRFQNMLLTYQYRCSKSPNDYWINTMYGSGLGSGMVISVVNFLKAFELGKIYRPTSSWLWAADNDSEHCYNHYNSIDCFNLPLTSCWYEGPDNNVPSSVVFNKTDALNLIKGPTDICTLASRSKKTILWVMGQFLHYHMRLPHLWEKKVRARVETIFPKISNKLKKKDEIDPVTGKKCITASIHVRGGTPDFSRKPMDGTDHYRALQHYNLKLNAKNTTICKVYVSGDHLEDTIFFPKNLKIGEVGNFSAAFTVQNGSFVFMSLPRYIAAPGELEYQVVNIRNSHNITMSYLYSEYIEDLLLHAEADVFIGSHSNIFAIVGALRHAYHPNFKSDQTCYLDSRYSPPPLHCMNSYDVIAFYHGALGGFNGGSIFFPDE